MLFSTVLSAALALPLLALAAPVDVEKRGGSRFTYYDTSVGLGACGNWNANSAYTVALNSADYAAWGGGYPSAVCGKKIWVKYGGKTVSASIQDECPSCSKGQLDLSEGLFGSLADKDLGVIYGTWGYQSTKKTKSRAIRRDGEAEVEAEEDVEYDGEDFLTFEQALAEASA
ncbi:RlpA-like double-psi beta-barrel domain [Phaffia rhodozyma]|uniref:RlpA-like double-psi beta-barrel domain n=1 Tax=Phaffia rhodozyma TaxID=264483 RepID=A0A0F7SSV4_PHARH|nr:RlpA-like double-psi beta-barrel domain [Phaffia rhodozyma]